MGLSETIVAAIIGAAATMATAIFQLVRNRAPSETRPKKKRLRSLIATIALMIGCIVGGYAWSALRAVSAKDEMKATLEAEFNKQFAALAAHQNIPAAQATAPGVSGAIPARNGEDGSADVYANLPPCRIATQPDDVGPVSCTESAALPIELCAAIPSAAHMTTIRVFSRVPKSEAPWAERDAGAPTLGSLHIGPSPAEYAVSADKRSVCLDVANWSVEDTLAVRVVVDYSSAAPSAELTAAAPVARSL